MLCKKLFSQSSSLITPVSGVFSSHRGFYSWLNYVWNRVAAEWVLRCGGSVRFRNADKVLNDYNAIPTGPKGHDFLEAIDASNACIIDTGLNHLVGLKYLESLSLSKCGAVADMNKLLVVKETLRELDISYCGNVKDMEPLVQLRKLQKLNLTGIQLPDSSVELVEKGLPECTIQR